MLSEFELIARYFTRPTAQTILGVGDDGAIIRPTQGMDLVVTTDMLVEGTHFFPNVDAESLGWKAMAVNLSDLAAMGARPQWAVIAVSLPEADEAWIAAFATGFFALAQTYKVDVIGGDTTRGPLTISPTLFGEVPPGRALRRDGAQAGDDIWVSGSPGRAALALAHLRGQISLSSDSLPGCLEALHRPQPRVELGMALQGIAHAAIDISDGLLADLGHILTRSRLAADIFITQLHSPLAALIAACGDSERAMQCLLAGGDDYELLFTVEPQHSTKIEVISQTLGLPLCKIGKVHAGVPGELNIKDEAGQLMPITQHGFDHFN